MHSLSRNRFDLKKDTIIYKTNTATIRIFIIALNETQIHLLHKFFLLTFCFPYLTSFSHCFYDFVSILIWSQTLSFFYNYSLSKFFLLSKIKLKSSYIEDHTIKITPKAPNKILYLVSTKNLSTALGMFHEEFVLKGSKIIQIILKIDIIQTRMYAQDYGLFISKNLHLNFG